MRLYAIRSERFEQDLRGLPAFFGLPKERIRFPNPEDVNMHTGSFPHHEDRITEEGRRRLERLLVGGSSAGETCTSARASPEEAGPRRPERRPRPSPARPSGPPAAPRRRQTRSSSPAWEGGRKWSCRRGPGEGWPPAVLLILSAFDNPVGDVITQA